LAFQQLLWTLGQVRNVVLSLLVSVVCGLQAINIGRSILSDAFWSTAACCQRRT